MSKDETNNMPSMETSMGMHSLTRQERRKRMLGSEIAKKIDRILFTEWDPIGVHWIQDCDCLDEYLSYVPEIVRMVEDGCLPSQISEHLWMLETVTIGVAGSRRRCDVIAILVSRYGPLGAAEPFCATVNTETPALAYQSVLDLVAQTRLDAYVDQWESVCIGYESAIAICQAHLQDKAELLGTCLSNLGHAYSHLGQLEKAQGYFETALSKLAPEAVSDDGLYLSCLNNLIANLEYRGLFDLAGPFRTEHSAYVERTTGPDYDDMGDSEHVGSSATVSEVASQATVQRELICNRLPVECDGRVGPPPGIEIE